MVDDSSAVDQEFSMMVKREIPEVEEEKEVRGEWKVVDNLDLKDGSAQYFKQERHNVDNEQQFKEEEDRDDLVYDDQSDEDWRLSGSEEEGKADTAPSSRRRSGRGRSARSGGKPQAQKKSVAELSSSTADSETCESCGKIWASLPSLLKHISHIKPCRRHYGEERIAELRAIQRRARYRNRDPEKVERDRVARIKVNQNLQIK